MGIKRSTMRDKVRTVTVNWEDETVDVGVYPGRYTTTLVNTVQDAVREAEAAAERGDDAAASEYVSTIAMTMGEVIAWWDVLDENDERLPITTEVIDSLPLSFVNTVMSGVGEAVRPPANRG